MQRIKDLIKMAMLVVKAWVEYFTNPAFTLTELGVCIIGGVVFALLAVWAHPILWLHILLEVLAYMCVARLVLPLFTVLYLKLKGVYNED